MTQIGLPFDWPADDDTSDFLVSATNSDAIKHLNSWTRWPVRASVLSGPRKSGKSLLGRIFAARSGGVLIDNADEKPDDMLFHAWNIAQENNQPLLMIGNAPPQVWAIRLPDLKSRLGATPHVSIGMIDDDLGPILLSHLLSKRGLVIAPDAAHYVITRIDRSYVAILSVVDVLDSAALAQKRAITIPFARETLINCGIIVE
jgi:hypothetical protein